MVTASVANIASNAGDSLSINTVDYNVASFENLDTAGIVALINQNSATHGVVATNPLLPTVLESYDDGLNPANGDVVIVYSADGGASNTAMQINVSDGNNNTNIEFNTSDGTFPGTGGAYLTVSATQMVLQLNEAFNLANVDIVASTKENTSGNNNTVFPKLVLTLGNTGSSITITEIAGDAAGQTFQQAIAMPLTASASSDSTLTLTRADGGDIALTGSGTFVNSNGMVSSSSGTPALLVMIEDEEGTVGVAETGVDIKEEITCNNTTNDGDAVGGSISYTPFSDGNVMVKVNGLAVDVSNDKNGVIYFSADGGLTAKTITNITAGDSLYWNGSVAGYQLETSDDLDITYQKSSND